MVTVVAVVHDPRRQPPTTRHTLETLLPITRRATMGGAQPGVESAPWGQATGEGRAAKVSTGPQGCRPTIRVDAAWPCSTLRASRRPWGAGGRPAPTWATPSLPRAGNTRRRSLDRAKGHGPMPVVKAGASAQELGRAPAQVTPPPTRAPPAPRGAVGALGPAPWGPSRRWGPGGERPTASGAGRGRRAARTSTAAGVDRAGDDLGLWRRGAPPRAPPGAGGDAAQVAGGHGRLATRRGWSPAARAGLGAGARGAGRSRGVLGDSRRPLGAEDRGARRDERRALPGAPDDDAPPWNRGMRTPGASANRGPWEGDVALGAEGHRPRPGARAPPLAWRRPRAFPCWRQAHAVTVGRAATQTRAGGDHDDWRNMLSHT